MHKADALLEKAIGRPVSLCDSFKEAVDKDITALSRKFETNLKEYYGLYQRVKDPHIEKAVQSAMYPDQPKPDLTQAYKEIFADCGASITTGTGTEIKEKVQMMDKLFPEAKKYVAKFMYLIGQR